MTRIFPWRSTPWTHDCPLDDPFVVIPIVLRGLDAVADEHQFRIVEFHTWVGCASDGDEVFEIFQLQFLGTRVGFGGFKLPDFIRSAGNTQHRYRLTVGTKGVDRLQSHRLELRFEVELRDGIAVGAWSASFEKIIGQEADVATQCRLLDPALGIFDRLSLDGGWCYQACEQEQPEFMARQAPPHCRSTIEHEGHPCYFPRMKPSIPQPSFSVRITIPVGVKNCLT